MNDSARVRVIDLLRGASAIAVVLFHFNVRHPPANDLYHHAVAWGWMGVSVFFIVSGFCIAAARTKDDLIPFWARRLVRIFPAYWASIAVVLGVIALRFTTAGINDVASLPQNLSGLFYTATALFAQAGGGHDLNWAYWSLGYELAFYILMGALVTRRSGVLLIPLSLVGFVLPVFPFDHWGLFGLGVACFYLTQKQFRIGVPLALVCTVLIFYGHLWVEGVTCVATALLILFPPKFFLHAIFAPIGKVGLFSYSLYLTHVPVGCYLIYHYLPWPFERTFWSSMWWDLISLTGCLLFAYLFYRGVEKPTHEYARQKLPMLFKRERGKT